VRPERAIAGEPVGMIFVDRYESITSLITRKSYRVHLQAIAHIRALGDCCEQSLAEGQGELIYGTNSEHVDHLGVFSSSAAITNRAVSANDTVLVPEVTVCTSGQLVSSISGSTGAH
jgi:hypothetical protein